MKHQNVVNTPVPSTTPLTTQLGFVLRSLETNMQWGMGQGHGLVALIRVSK